MDEDGSPKICCWNWKALPEFQQSSPSLVWKTAEKYFTPRNEFCFIRTVGPKYLTNDQHTETKVAWLRVRQQQQNVELLIPDGLT